MMRAIPDILSPQAVADLRARLLAADWIDGNATSGAQSALAKRNRQLPEDSPVAADLGGQVLDALGRSPLFVAAALPLKVYPPLFNAYSGGEAFGTHVDAAIRIRRGSDFRIRSDLSATLFLSDPDDYDGGELVIEGGLAPQRIKLPAGHMLLYPANTLHRVEPVTRGTRHAAFFWIQSMVRDLAARTMLFDLDQSIQALGAALDPGHAELVRLTGLYHNLLRRWADA
ncbi:Fe2+-dependent dioxygenase [Sphingomonas prati]|uniref:PKHD-type hydroxylase n=1 Tax=Sphingomonas prati TaxID=1843237 RepID=A0A7W9BTR0_9SPHN|nr:Fe2+-dependent dioxygenase [Sphingomonas prati]MBB5729952.1 PKHD-type hydroxylase [Sphingomonas prati]GGE88243.1 PKHD-type hydroxylase [Sphingomonas prati]